MGVQLDLTDIQTGFLSAAALTANNTLTEQALDKALDRTGSTNNAMEVNLDMGLNSVINVTTDVNDPTSLLTVADADTRYVNYLGDTLGGDIDAGGFQINNLGTPTTPFSAARAIDVGPDSAALLRSEIQDGIRKVPSLSALEAIEGRYDGDVAYMAGRTTAGDGGEGIFRWDSSDLSSTLVLSSVTSTSVDDITDTITLIAHGLRNGDGVVSQSAVNGLSINTVYWVVNATTDTFQLSETFGGAAFDLIGANNFTVDHLLDPAKGVYIVGASDLAGTGGAWVRRREAVFSVGWFGAIGDGITDDLPAITSCLRTVAEISIDNAYTLVGAGLTTRPRITIDFGYQKSYRVSSTVFGSTDHRMELSGERSVISPDDFSGFVFDLDGAGLDVLVRGLVLESTQDGIFKMNYDNISSALVTFYDCRFVDDAYDHHTGVAVDYTNRSSSLVFNRCYFNRMKHPLYSRDCDFIRFDDCWFGFAVNAVYADRDGYIKHDNGFLKIDNCLFAGGPAQPLIGAIPNGTEIAYVNCGNEITPSVAEYHPRVSITRTRIGYEFGAGVLVNYFGPHNTPDNGQQFRCGIVLDDIQTAPREEKLNALDGTATGYLVRLFDMPNQLIIKNVHGNPGFLGGFASGSTTTLAALRAKVVDLDTKSDVFDFTGDIADFQDISANSNFAFENVTAPNFYPVLTEDTEEYQRWLHIFGKFNWFFESNNPADAGASPTMTINTWFDGFDSQRGAIFHVTGGGLASVAGGNNVKTPIIGSIYVQYDENGDTVYAKFAESTEYSSVPQGFNIIAGFDVSGVFNSTITLAQASAGATLAIQIQNSTNPGVINIRVRGLRIIPDRVTWFSLPNGGAQQ